MPVKYWEAHESVLYLSSFFFPLVSVSQNFKVYELHGKTIVPCALRAVGVIFFSSFLSICILISLVIWEIHITIWTSKFVCPVSVSQNFKVCGLGNYRAVCTAVGVFFFSSFLSIYILISLVMWEIQIHTGVFALKIISNNAVLLVILLISCPWGQAGCQMKQKITGNLNFCVWVIIE